MIHHDPYWITIKKPAICRRCQRPIEAGERVFYYKTGDVYCDKPSCGGAESASFQAAKIDEQFYGQQE